MTNRDVETMVENDSPPWHIEDSTNLVIRNDINNSLKKKTFNHNDFEIDGANEGQLAAFNELKEIFIEFKKTRVPPKNIYSILGAAGSGKSWLISKIVEFLSKLGLRTRLTTPTHKALGVLKGMVNNIELGSGAVDTGTIHNFLNLKVDFGISDDTENDDHELNGKARLVLNTFNMCLDSTDVLFIDESSMVDDGLYNYTEAIIGDRAYIVIFVGDYFQLPPPGGGLSPIFYDNDKIKTIQLTETVRQKADSVIINKSNWLKYYIAEQKFPTNIMDLFAEDENEIKIFDSRKDPQEHNRFLEEYLKDDSNRIIGSYTNKMVDEYNTYVRNIVKNNPADRLIIGDILVTQSPYSRVDNIQTFNNGEEFEITGLQIKNEQFRGLNVYQGTYQKILEQTEIGKFVALHESSLDQYEELLLEYKNAATAERDRFKKKKHWREYFKMLNKFVQYKYIYASTIHKLQGSTYENTYFDSRDLLWFYKKNPDLVCRLVYVIITRPTKNLYILK
jgi:hypothetical protein